MIQFIVLEGHHESMKVWCEMQKKLKLKKIIETDHNSRSIASLIG